MHDGLGVTSGFSFSSLSTVRAPLLLKMEQRLLLVSASSHCCLFKGFLLCVLEGEREEVVWMADASSSDEDQGLGNGQIALLLRLL